mmetsp:Transcript_10737/g.17161  ORF Transcript_10737/g.17161 Transcript_10737/m.17161 type:complete len:259 (+) Transcript_10737:199-975(+)|eukprot:CAMPEP_0178751382 /NCGR_PEP_ID=MMETSP0744-20121128/10500_1 /TAXON_ID=913974 /ORGANISM="Nitzschia punctata, Strain CCMP561" /LENGTH=258 /DNA_ID=CAMNT_0020405031 /DNA_START=206 /DNA_END=982 /DNA_ORIENTATION=-
MTMSFDNHSISILPSRLPQHETVVNETEVKLSEMVQLGSHLEMNRGSRSSRTVSFGPSTVVGFVENRASLCKRERERRWLSSVEFVEVKSKCQENISELKASPTADIFSYRGMEMVDPEAVVRRQRRHTNSVTEVLIAQRDQRFKEVTNPRAIRKAYKRTVLESMREALENAYIDRKAVVEYLSTAEKELQEVYNYGTKKDQERHPRRRRFSLFGSKAERDLRDRSLFIQTTSSRDSADSKSSARTSLGSWSESFSNN